MESLDLMDVPSAECMGLLQLLIRFAFNAVVVWCIIHLLYYPKSRRLDYYFTFSLISLSIFFLIFLLGSVKLKIGFALGLFAIFGIIRYRTESMPVREMTYLFVIIAVSVINALGSPENYIELLFTNALFLLTIWLCERNRKLKHLSDKLIVYDRVELIVPERRQELLDDLQERTGLEIKKLEIGAIDFLHDTVMLKVYYETENTDNTIEHIVKLPKTER
jgi:hypothetical protein